MYTVYVIQNKKNLKIYVGQTNNIKRRWSRHRYEAFTKLNDKPLYRSIRKYGMDNFELIELEQHSKEDVDTAEYGYNLTIGGNLHSKSLTIKPRTPSMLGKHHTPETRQKMSEDRSGEKNAFYGKQHNQQSKQLMSQNPNRKYFGKDNPFYGKKFAGDENPLAKLTAEIVIEARKLYQEGMTFVQLSEKYSVSESAISRAVRGITWSHL